MYVIYILCTIGILCLYVCLTHVFLDFPQPWLRQKLVISLAERRLGEMVCWAQIRDATDAMVICWLENGDLMVI